MPTEPTPPFAPSVYVITQRDHDGRTRRQTTADRYGPLAINSQTLFVFYSPTSTEVVGFIHLAELQSFHTAIRDSFRHPILGLIFALSLLAATPFIPILGIVFCITVSAVVFWEVIRNRKVVWLVLETRSGRREFLLVADQITPDIQACLDTLRVVCQTLPE